MKKIEKSRKKLKNRKKKTKKGRKIALSENRTKSGKIEKSKKNEKKKTKKKTKKKKYKGITVPYPSIVDLNFSSDNLLIPIYNDPLPFQKFWFGSRINKIG